MGENDPNNFLEELHKEKKEIIIIIVFDNLNLFVSPIESRL